MVMEMARGVMPIAWAMYLALHARQHQVHDLVVPGTEAFELVRHWGMVWPGEQPVYRQRPLVPFPVSEFRARNCW